MVNQQSSMLIHLFCDLLIDDNAKSLKTADCYFSVSLFTETQNRSVARRPII